MSIVRPVGGLSLGHWPNFFAAIPAFASLSMSATAHKVALVFRAPKTGTLDSFEFRISAVANVPDNGLRLSFQSLDASADPDGVIDQFRNITSGITVDTWMIPPGPITSDGTDTGVKRTVVVGELLACVVDFVSFVASDSVTLTTLNLGVTYVKNDGLIPYTDHFSTAWSKSPAIMCVALKYSDGYYPISESVAPILTLNQRNVFDTGSTPDERALRFQVPFECEMDGVFLRYDQDGVCDIILYDAADSVLSTSSIVAAARESSTAGNIFIPIAPIILDANTTYRIAIKPTTVTDVTAFDYTVNSNALLAAMYGGIEWYSSTRVDGGSWTDITNERPFIMPHISGIETGGAGGGEHSHTFLG